MRTKITGHRRIVAAQELSTRWRDLRLARRRITRISRALALAYGTPDLGNLPDPLDEAAYIILTFQTDIPRARRVWQTLKARFPSWHDVLAAREADLAEVLRPSGLHVARARLLRSMLRDVLRASGDLSLEACRTMRTEDAEKWLRKLPGLDWKGARCVLLYSFGRRVLPVDSNTYRFAIRFGILRRGTPYRRATVHDALQELVPPAHRHDLHVNLVVHGQRTCVPGVPYCADCPVRRRCATGRAVRPQGSEPPRTRRGTRMRRQGLR